MSFDQQQRQQQQNHQQQSVPKETMSEGTMASGYLYKFSKSKSSTMDPPWKKRFFMLHGCILTYYNDHLSTQESKGELLVFAETVVIPCDFHAQQYCLSLAEPFPPLMLAADTQGERDMWVKCFTRAITAAKFSLRGNIYRRSSAREGGNKLKYFILHENALTYHKNRDNIFAVQGLIHINSESYMEYNDDKSRITLVDTISKYTLSLQFGSSSSEEKGGGDSTTMASYEEWKIRLVDTMTSVGAMIRGVDSSTAATQVALGAAGSQQVGEQNEVIKQGPLYMRPPKGGEPSSWPEYFFRLRSSELIVLDVLSDPQKSQIVGEIKITPNCSVFETNLGPNTFELVSNKRVLHLMPTSKERGQKETSSWLEAIRSAISYSFLDTSDPLLQSVMLLIDDDEFYEVCFHEKRPMGVVFERAGEWAIIKTSSNAATSGIRVGSVLSAINGTSVILESYQTTIEQLKNWQPPLTLRFRVAPEKSGYLLKESKCRKDPEKKVWKKRFFVLSEGKLSYKDTADVNEALKVEIPLMGSAVSLVPAQESGKFYCFRLISGVACLIVQSATEKQMMDWASTLYHAIAIANGGSYIIGYERDRLIAAEEERIADLLAAGDIGTTSPSSPSNDSTRAPSAAAISAAETNLNIKMAQASIDDTSPLENAIAIAKRLGVNTTKAETILQDLHDRKRKVEAALERLAQAIKSQSVHFLEAAVLEAEALGLIRESQPARSLIISINKQDAEVKLELAIKQATLLDDALLVNAIERAKKLHIDSSKVVDAQAHLIQLRRKRIEHDETIESLKAASKLRSIPKMEIALAHAVGLEASGLFYGSSEYDVALKTLKTNLMTLKKEIMEEELTLATKHAIESTADDSDDSLESLKGVLESAQASGYFDGQEESLKRAKEAVVSIEDLKARKKHLLLLIAAAVDVESADDLERYLAMASEMRLVCPEIDNARALLIKLQDDDKLIRFWMEAAERTQQEEAEKARIAAEEAELQAQRDAMLKLQLQASEDALQDAVQSSDHDSIELLVTAIATAVENGVNPAMIENANAVLTQLQLEKKLMDEARSELMAALAQDTPLVIEKLEKALDKAKMVNLVDALRLRAESELFRLQHIAEEARIAKEREIRSEVEARQRAAASEAARRALLAAEERIRQEMKERSKAEAELDLTQALRSPTIDSIEELEAALIAAEKASLDAAIIASGNEVLKKLKAEQEKIKQVTEQLQNAVHYGTISDLSDAIAAAEMLWGASGESGIGGGGAVGDLFDMAVALLSKKKSEHAAKVLEEAMRKSNITAMDTLSDAIDEAERCKVEPEILFRAQSHLADIREAKMKRDRAINAIKCAIDTQHIKSIEKALHHAASIMDGALKEDVVFIEGIKTLHKLRLEECETALEIAEKKAIWNDFEILSQAIFVATTSDFGELKVNPTLLNSCTQKLNEFRTRKANYAIVQNEIENALHEDPLSISRITSSLELAASLGVDSLDLIERAKKVLTKLQVAEQERLLNNAMQAATIDDVEKLESAIDHAEASKLLEAFRINAAKSKLQQLREAKKCRTEVLSAIATATESRSLVNLEKALEAAARQTFLRGELLVKEGQALLAKLVEEEAISNLEKAMHTANIDDFDALADAISVAEPMKIAGSLVNDAKLLLARLQNARAKRTEVIGKLEAAVAAQGIPDLIAALKAAESIKLTGEFVDDGKALLLMLQQAHAEADLDIYVAFSWEKNADFTPLSEAITASRLYGVDKTKVEAAEALLNRLLAERDEWIFTIKLLEEAIQEKSVESLEKAISKAMSIDMIEENVDQLREAKGVLQVLFAEKEKNRIYNAVADAVRLRSIPLLQKALAMATEVGMEGDALDKARSFLEELLSLKEQEDAAEAENEALRRNKAARDAASAMLSSPTSSQLGNTDDLSGDEEEDGTLDAAEEEARLAERAKPRKLATRRSRRFTFNEQDAASAEDLRLVFSMYGTKASEDGEQPGFINAMQFSNIWRLITEEKGNLFKEMQNFKKFDTNNNGVLYCEEFVDGFIRMSHEAGGQRLLSRIKSLASPEDATVT